MQDETEHVAASSRSGMDFDTFRNSTWGTAFQLSKTYDELKRAEYLRNSANISTVIGPGVTFKGDLSAAEDLLLEGKFEGMIQLWRLDFDGRSNGPRACRCSGPRSHRLWRTDRKRICQRSNRDQTGRVDRGRFEHSAHRDRGGRELQGFDGNRRRHQLAGGPRPPPPPSMLPSGDEASRKAARLRPVAEVRACTSWTTAFLRRR